MTPQAILFTGVSPKESACSACTCGVLTHFSHMYAQFGCFALVASIQVSPHPVAPSWGIVSATWTFPSEISWLVWYGHALPTMASPFSKRLISSLAPAQYFLISGRCCMSRLTTALNCVWVSSYGSVIFRFGLFLLR